MVDIMKKYTNEELIERVEKAKKNRDKLPHVKLKLSKKEVTYVDPPHGWAYDFPKILPDNVTDFRKWLIENNYPEKDVDFAMKYCRMWKEEIEE